VVIRQQENAEIGEIVAAMIDCEATAKTLTAWAIYRLSVMMRS
jgi:SOS-response transcriptional repressor LexA